MLMAKVLPASGGLWDVDQDRGASGCVEAIEEFAALVRLLEEPVAHARLGFGMGQEQPDAAVQPIQIGA